MTGDLLGSTWLLPLLALAVLADGPLPFLPSEPVLLSSVAAAGDAGRVVALAAAAFVGSLAGDALLYTLGRSSHRFLRGRRDDTWVRRQLHRRPMLTLVAVRFLPGGRLVSVAAAGRVRIPVIRFVPATVVSSAVWCGYMTGMGLLIAPVTRGDPVLSLLAGICMATVIGAVGESARRIVARRRAAAPAAPLPARAALPTAVR
ncbi:DedA family protein [Prauserella alba]|uniref:VTT domain-containing protein n=1 Tax=Prauserella alba TaxID=176898 RepID=A0ABN1VC40_9PSEU|nr:VTT domain-containing protein [Prauserella alba]MCP2178995.1 membrane protein DedA, SNARE-associated domain [Prauserella alba]